MIKQLLADRSIPAPIGRNETLQFFREHLYGFAPEAPLKIGASVTMPPKRIYAGQATHEKVMLSWETPGGTFSMTVDLIVPVTEKPVPTFLFLSFRPVEAAWTTPFEEVIDAGYAIAAVEHNAITSDIRTERGGILMMYPADAATGWGKISAWAFGAQRLMDYLVTREDIDSSRVAVVGHSRLGKTALWCAAQDERFTLSGVVQSGCGGAALNRGKIGETLPWMTKMIPDWFCGNFQEYAFQVNHYPVDQHDLIAALAPRKAYICSALEDEWADPASEFLACAAASPAYEALGEVGLVAENRLPQPGDVYHEGSIGYHLREGIHFFPRYDWMKLVEYRKKHDV